jgi:hypothetical protein
MHEHREHLPFEYAALAFLAGFAYVSAVMLAVFIVCTILHMVRGKDARDRQYRPFMTPALRDAMAKRP